ncbi:MAG: hypothetical protein JST16_02895 [Bdellovibrionales bacterium]|nr:hypothetical protein [Bdellovibrionales bacterium]
MDTKTVLQILGSFVFLLSGSVAQASGCMPSFPYVEAIGKTQSQRQEEMIYACSTTVWGFCFFLGEDGRIYENDVRADVLPGFPREGGHVTVTVSEFEAQRTQPDGCHEDPDKIEQGRYETFEYLGYWFGLFTPQNGT